MKTRLVLLLLSCSALSFAQESRGAILGRVSDTSGAPIAGAAVRATNPETGITLSATANAEGNYFLPYLVPGKYTVSAELTGFKKLVQNEIEVRVTDQVKLDFALQVGDVKEVMEVTAETPLLNTAEASLGQVVDQRRAVELPLFAGNAMDLVHLAPGTVNGTNLRLRKAPFNSAPSQFSTNGAGNNVNEFSIDGVVNTYSDGTAPRVAFSVPQMAISEFKIQTTPYDASMGHTMGSVVNVNTKGGTNALHGEAHWWFRNKAFDTPTIFQNRSGAKPAQYTDNRYGFALGGPLTIPKVYNGKNKTFWFYAWEANKFQDPANQQVSTVPIPQVRQGDLSPYLALGAAYQVFDPNTTVAGANGLFTRTPFPGNRIPASRLDPVALNILKAWPEPNQPTTNREFRNNFFRSSKALEDYWTNIGRIDHTISEKHRLFGRMHRDYWQEDKNRFFDANDNITGIVLNRVNRGVALDDVYVFSPSLLMNLRYGITQQEFPERRVSQGYDLSKLGFSAALVNSLDRTQATFPRTNVAPFSLLSNWESGEGATSSLIHHYSGTITKVTGAHTLRFGFDGRVNREFRNRYPQQTSPDLVFGGGLASASTGAAAPQLGGEITTFLLGIPGGSMARVASYAEQDKYMGLFFQDDWKLTKKLTVNAGLRWDLESGITERFDRSVYAFNTTTPTPIASAAVARYAAGTQIPELPASQFKVNGGLTFANTGGNPRNYWNARYTNFQPRIGLAYQLDAKTVFRAGYGIFTAPIGVYFTNTIQTGFSQTTPIQATLDNGLTYIARTANPFPNGLLQPTGASQGLATNLGQALQVYDPTRKNPYAQRWSFGFQRQLPGQFVIESTYVGNRATRLAVDRDLNAFPNQFLSTSPVRDQDRINLLGANFANPFSGLSSVYGTNTNRGQFLRPYPQFGTITVNQPVGYSWYHAMQSRIERRFSQGLTAQFSHTWSKAMEAVQFLNAGDARPYENISGIDRTQAIRGSAIWEVPFGRGRRWGGNINRVTNFVAGGWQLNGVMQKQSGQPLSFGNRIFNGDLSQVQLPKNERSVDRWLRLVPNTDAATAAARPLVPYGFEWQAARQLGSNLRQFPLNFGGIRGPGQSRWDFSAIKNFKFKERLNTQFRAETYNATNFPNLGNPNTDPTNAAYGTITSQDSPRSWQFALRLTF
ncbi:MAG: carboxypeptidase-like regulatory domain-containing protein [Bryobacteraceae bacterium]|nr:carboxypeptidase-like regulatory domain-containing protein [Bryobacteraceae bacterium]